MGMDPFDEFEFKPLTEGLGFHQDPNKQKTPAKNTPEVPAQLKGLDFEEPTTPQLFKTPLPRQNPKSPSAPSTDHSAVDDILKTLHKSRKEQKTQHQAQTQELRTAQRQEKWTVTPPLFAAMILDAMLVTAAILLCMIIVLMITRVDLLKILSQPDGEGMVYLATALLIAGVSFIYVVTHRVFMGHTPGEWAYDVQAKENPTQQKNSARFMLGLIARQVLATISGLIVLPLLSVLIRKDLLGILSGTRLYKKS